MTPAIVTNVRHTHDEHVSLSLSIIRPFLERFTAKCAFENKDTCGYRNDMCLGPWTASGAASRSLFGDRSPDKSRHGRFRRARTRRRGPSKMKTSHVLLAHGNTILRKIAYLKLCKFGSTNTATMNRELLGTSLVK